MPHAAKMPAMKHYADSDSISISISKLRISLKNIFVEILHHVLHLPSIISLI